MQKLKPIPKFKDENEEFEFWATHDTTEYFDWSKAQRAVFPNLKPSCHVISLRLPEEIIAQYKTYANKQDVPYQSLMKIALCEDLAKKRSMFWPTKAVRKKKKTGRSASRSATD